MKQVKITHSDIQLLDFVASRLLYFKRIDLAILLEVLGENFPHQNAVNLLGPMIDEKIMRIENEHLVPLNERVLEQFLLGYVNADLSPARETN